MPKSVIIDVSLRHDGLLQVPDLTILPGGGLVTEQGLQVVADGDILVAGSILGRPGASVSLSSLNGSVFVSGRIVLSRGRDAAKPGGSGENGGSVNIAAQSGEILVAGSIEAGHGGNGGDAANEPAPSDTRSGAGGSGGNVVLHGAFVTLRGGAVMAGNGGNGGIAIADGWRFDAMTDWFFANVAPAGGPMDLLPADPPEFPNVISEGEVAEALLAALSGNGGPGGEIRLVSTASGTLGWVLPGAVVKAGAGGNARTAKALRGIKARADVGRAGAGGKVLYAAGPGGALGVWQRNATEQPGVGGATENAVAGACKLAEAHVPAGGLGGKVDVEGLAATSLKGNGGDAGQALAETPVCRKVDGPHSGGPGGPGASATAHC